MFADLILPLAVPNLFAYSVPAEFAAEISAGCSVVASVQNKMYLGIVDKLYDDEPRPYIIKPIISIVDTKPVVNKYQLKFWKWIAEYYICTIGEVMIAALPSEFRLQSKTVISALDYNADIEVNDREAELYSLIEQNKKITLQQLVKKASAKTILPTLKTMFEKGMIFFDEDMKNKYKPKFESIVKLNENIRNEADLENAFKRLKKSKRQENLLINYCSMFSNFDFENPPKTPKTLLLKQSQTDLATLNVCIKKQIFEIENIEISRFSSYCKNINPAPELTDIQRNALDEIKKHFETKNTVLLYGVTSSGKTEIYFKLIETQLQQGKQVLYLLPEITLTQQLLVRLQKVFGNKVGVYHSKHSENERVEVYNNIRGSKPQQQEYSIIIGARSAMFLPFSNLGLVIVDEEHDQSYKQRDIAPLYNARDAAIMLAQIHKAKTLLGSATPSIESFYNAKKGKYGLVQLSERFGNAQLPKSETVSLLRAYAKNEMNGHFTKSLLNVMFDALKNNEQIILFHNRRGFAPYLQCNSCGEIPHCKHCNVSLTYHQRTNNLRCHYCGYSVNLYQKCPKCESEKLQKKGMGTEKIEDEIKVIFPKAQVAIFDADSVQTRNAYVRIINAFENRSIDILVGTQIVSKGLDFDNVSVVGILNADNLLNFSDFRAHERAFQLMTQVSGRAGRREKTGRVIIQTFNPDNKIIRNIVDNDYENLFAKQIVERKEFCYPPFFRLINITIKHRNINVLDQAANAIVNCMKQLLGSYVLGPEYPAINKIQNKFICNILLKIGEKTLLTQAKETLLQCIADLKQQKKFNSLIIQIDVDP